MSNHNKAIFRLKKKRKAYLCSKSKNNKKVSNYSSNNKSKSFWKIKQMKSKFPPVHRTEIVEIVWICLL